MYSRFVNLLPKVLKLSSRKSAIFVFVERFYEFSSSILWILQLIPQDVDRLVYRNKFFTSEKNNAQTNNYNNVNQTKLCKLYYTSRYVVVERDPIGDFN